MTSKVSDAFTCCAQSALSVAKLIIESRPATITHFKAPERGRIIILGNGPSLNTTIAESLDTLRRSDTMAVNFFAITPAYDEIRPKYYILVDPLFFTQDKKANFALLDQRLAATSWEMTLIVPARHRTALSSKITSNPKISVATVNAVGIEGWQWLTDMAYRRGWGMPRPRNVLIPALMAAIQMGYKEIFVTGADHSWMSTISVNERNEVVSVQPHFYKDDEKEEIRQRTDYLRYPLHEIIHSFYVAFKSYHDIRRYADRHGINIYNATPGSFIDAFERVVDLPKV